MQGQQAMEMFEFQLAPAVVVVAEDSARSVAASPTSFSAILQNVQQCQCTSEYYYHHP